MSEQIGPSAEERKKELLELRKEKQNAATDLETVAEAFKQQIVNEEFKSAKEDIAKYKVTRELRRDEAIAKRTQELKDKLEKTAKGLVEDLETINVGLAAIEEELQSQ